MEKRTYRAMGITRKPYQGVLNIVRFNWHFYLFFIMGVIGFALIDNILPSGLQIVGRTILFLSISTTVISLVVSYFIYDASNLYSLNWLQTTESDKLLNIHAGFDEASAIIKLEKPHQSLAICDFYDPKIHTEVSIRRARKAYPPVPETIPVSTDKLPFNAEAFDHVIVFLAAHEIRKEKERMTFFKELNRVTKIDGHIYVTEHFRDKFNFLAYSIGFIHFLSRNTWQKTFDAAELTITKETKITPFITTFTLRK